LVDAAAVEANACAPKLRCRGSCIDPDVDVNHCGGCGVACSVGDAGTGGLGGNVAAACVKGKCTLACGGLLKLCGGACVDTSNDPARCGDCTTVCAAGSCIGGICKPGVTTRIGHVDDLGIGSETAQILNGTLLTVTKTSQLLGFGILSKSTGPNVVMALYAEVDGTMGTLVAQSSVSALTGSPDAPAALAFAATSQPTLIPGNYWLVAVFDAYTLVGQTFANPGDKAVSVKHVFGTPLPISLPTKYAVKLRQSRWITVLE